MSSKQQQIDNVLETFKRLKQESLQTDSKGNKTALALLSKKTYNEKVSQLKDMREGGDGGLFRKTETSIRVLHYNGWLDRDFQVMLEQMSETAIMTEEEKAERWPDERGFFSRMINNLFGG